MHRYDGIRTVSVLDQGTDVAEKAFGSQSLVQNLWPLAKFSLS